MIICATYRKNPSRTVDATERTPFSKSRPNDLEDIGQGQRSSHATHPLMLLIICTKYGKNPSWTVDATGRTRKVNRQTDGQTDRRTDRQTGWIQYTPPNFVAGCIKRTWCTWCHPSTVSTCTWICTCKFEKYLYSTQVLPKVLDPNPAAYTLESLSSLT